MKRTVCILLVMILLLAIFTGCGNTANTETTTEGTTMAQKDNYTPDSTLRILMVGNSFCYYYVEELYDMLMMNRPAGVDEVEVYNLYYSGCRLDQHLDWFNGKDVQYYQLFKTDKKGRQNLAPISKWTLEMALAQGNWDYISYQGRIKARDYNVVEDAELEQYEKDTAAMAKPILDHFHKMFPHTQLLWHRTWVSENLYRGDYGENEAEEYDRNMQAVCEYMCNVFDAENGYDMKMVNTGAAWTEVRSLNAAMAESLFPVGGLCARLGWNDYDGEVMHSGDGRHDGDIGGGQLLNAYMWYMTITGDADLSEVIDYKPVYKSGSTDYTMSDELVAMLQQAAVTTFASMADQ